MDEPAILAPPLGCPEVHEQHSYAEHGCFNQKRHPANPELAAFGEGKTHEGSKDHPRDSAPNRHDFADFIVDENQEKRENEYVSK